MSNDKICVCNVSVVRINGKTIQVGTPTNSPLDELLRSTNLAKRARKGDAVEY